MNVRNVLSQDYVHRRVLSFLVALELLLFLVFYNREIAWYAPLSFDQTEYLTETYQLQEQVLWQGPGKLWTNLWSSGHSTGLGLPIEGAISGLLLGGVRLPQLCVLFFAFVLLQLLAFATARAVCRRTGYGYMAVGLILCQTAAWFWAGGLFDFRIDFFAYCFYGIWTCAVVRSDLLLDRRWAIGSAVCGSILVLNRFLTITYLLGVSLGILALLVIIIAVKRGDTGLVTRMRRRLSNFGIYFGLSAIIVAPFLVRCWGPIHDYYVFGHGISAEKEIRALELGVHDLAGHLLFYPISVIRDHLGPAFFCAAALAILAAVVLRQLSRQRTSDGGRLDETPESTLLRIIFLLGAIAGPLIVLTIDISKSAVVGGIVGGPSALLVVCLAAAIGAHQSEASSSRDLTFFGAVAGIVFVIGLLNFAGHATRHLPQSGQRRYYEGLTDLDKWLVEYAAARNWKEPTISFDVISGDLNAGTITVTGYERLHQLIVFHPLLAGDIMAVSRAETLSYLAQSDFVILTNSPKTGVDPFYDSIRRYWEDVHTWAEQNMVMSRKLTVDDFTATVYIRPNPTVLGVSGNWITSAGLTLQAPRETVQRFPKIRLSGITDFSRLPKTPEVSATVEMGSGPQAIPAELKRDGNSYEISLDLPKNDSSRPDPVLVHVGFDTFYVPDKLRKNGDMRELVIRAPSQVRMSVE
ncbi:MAG TPA: hypothetical protein VE860_06005 [Chthoniobacterales bacterium]|nr:hypothetical protein [Chthoniobacterales bacterium]